MRDIENIKEIEMERPEQGLIRKGEDAYDIIIAGQYGVGTFTSAIERVKKCENCYEIKFSNGLTLWVNVVWDKVENNKIYDKLEEWKPEYFDKKEVEEQIKE